MYTHSSTTSSLQTLTKNLKLIFLKELVKIIGMEISFALCRPPTCPTLSTAIDTPLDLFLALPFMKKVVVNTSPSHRCHFHRESPLKSPPPIIRITSSSRYHQNVSHRVGEVQDEG